MRTFLPPLLIVLSAIALTVLLSTLKPEPEIIEPEIRPVLVDVLVVEPRSLPVSVKAQGTVRPGKQISLVSEVRGRVLEVADNFVAGGFFRADEVLLRIDERDYVARLDQAKALVAQARSALAQEKGRAYVAAQEWERRGGRDTMSREARDLAKRKPQMAEAQAHLDSARASLHLAEVDVERTVIRAPYDGIVAAKKADIGQFISAGTVLGEFLAVATAEVRLSIPEGKIPYLNLPDSYRGSASNREPPQVDLSYRLDGREHHWAAKLIRTEGILDERSRSLFVVAELPDPYGIYRDDSTSYEPLRFGLFVDARIEGRQVEQVVPLPRGVIRPGNLVWIVDSDDRLRQREVTLLRTDGAEIFVSGGLEPEDRVCLTSVGPVLPGTPVRIAATRRQPEPDAAQAVNAEPKADAAVTGGPDA